MLRVFLVCKRLFDFLFALLLVIVLSPLFVVLYVAIKMDSPGPVFFRQKRIGIHKTHFNILKYRTMRIDTPRDIPTHLMVDPQQYITRMGRFMRRYSLDELPQLFNILAGDMSFVGPRPALWNQYDLIEERDKYNANDVIVGLTGWAQVNGRDELPIPVKAEFDGYYAKHRGIKLDLICLYKTLFAVSNAHGVKEGGVK